MYFDFHGHSMKRNVFAYGPEIYEQMDWKAQEAKVVPLSMAALTDMFNFNDCSFEIKDEKTSTARVLK